MASIDTGLGWKCDERYFVDDTETQITRSGNQYYKCFKENIGAAICVRLNYGIQSSDSHFAALMSTEEANCIGDPDTYLYPTGIYDILGKTWYLYVQTSIGNNHAGDSSPINNFPIVECPEEWENIEVVANEFTPVHIPQTAEAIIAAAGAQVMSLNIPTTGYVHKYVEGVLKGMPPFVGEYDNENLYIH